MGFEPATKDVAAKKMIVAAGIAAMALSTGGVAYAGHANGLNGQACAASFGFAHLGKDCTPCNSRMATMSVACGRRSPSSAPEKRRV